MHDLNDTQRFEGLSIEDILPIDWTPVDLGDHSIVEHANTDTMRAISALAVYEEQPRGLNEDPKRNTSEIARVEAKLDLLLNLVVSLSNRGAGLPPERPVVLRGLNVEWQPVQPFRAEKGDTGIIRLWANSSIPMPMRIPAKIVSSLDRNGFIWWRASFDFLAPHVADALVKIIFRHHRRQVALARGTLTQGR